MGYLCNACGFYIKAGQAHSCYSPTPVDDREKIIKELRQQVSDLTAEVEQWKKDRREDQLRHYQLGYDYGKFNQVNMAYTKQLEADNERLLERLKIETCTHEFMCQCESCETLNHKER